MFSVRLRSECNTRSKEIARSCSSEKKTAKNKIATTFFYENYLKASRNYQF